MIALTGGIASGKSTVSKHLASLGAKVIDADKLAREVVKPGMPALEAIFNKFGDELRLKDGSLDRRMLGDMVFADPQALNTLNGIVHPAIKNLYEQTVREIVAADPEAVIVYDIPLLVEHAIDREWEHIVVASAPEDIRIERLINIRGLTAEEAKARVSNQASDEERRAIADTVIDTSTTLEETIRQTEIFWQSFNSSQSQIQ